MRADDTSAEVARMRSEIYRKMPAQQKWLLLGGAYHSVRTLHAAGVLARTPGATARDVVADWLRRVSKAHPSVPLSENVMDPVPPLLSEAREVIRVLDQLGIIYALGGSMASSVHGIPRSTQDADLTVLPFADRIGQFVAAFGPDYYVSRAAVDDAHQRYSCFNVLNTMSGFKADLFVAAPGGFAEAAVSRSTPMMLADNPAEPVTMVTPEDIILFKLDWYRIGGEVSDRQWQDVLEVMSVKRGLLDEARLDSGATTLGVTDLLARARQEVVP